MITRLCVFCGSADGTDPRFMEAASSLGAELARRHITLVYGGASVGLMGAIADAALGAGGKVIGVIPDSLKQKEIAHAGLTELHVVPSMHARKTKMADLSDAFIALPGGLGTLEEFFEIATWAQLKFHARPFGLLNVAGYFDLLLQFLDHAVCSGLLKPKYRALIHVSSTPAELLARFDAA